MTDTQDLGSRVDDALDAFRAGDSSKLERLSGSPQGLLRGIADPDEPCLLRGDKIGPFTIRRRIGRGASGVVYEAEQRDPTRTVAIKILRTKDSAEERLAAVRREAQILARLDHPGIAHVYTAGLTAEGFAYVAMEFIDGMAIDRFVAEHDLSLRERLQLLLRVAEACGYAHRNAVIHRDLKPSNILVDKSGRPHLLDFDLALDTAPSDDPTEVTLGSKPLNGTARLPVAVSVAGKARGTLPYMAPEQLVADARLDTSSDVYALGVVAFEVLSGRRPIEVDTDDSEAAIEAIREQQAPALSSVVATPGGSELDAVLARALAKRPAERYASANSFGQDLQRYLALEPVNALPSTPSRCMRLFVKRRPGLAGMIAALVAIVLVATVLVWAAARREHQEWLRGREVLAVLQQFVSLGHPDVAPHENLRVVEQLDILAQQAAADKWPAFVCATVHATVGRAYMGLGRIGDARENLERALALRSSLDPKSDEDLATSFRDLGFFEHARGNFEEAWELQSRGFALRKRLFDAWSEPVQQSREELAVLAVAMGKEGEARRLVSDGVREARRSHDDLVVLRALTDAGTVYHDSGARREALEFLKEAYTLASGRKPKALLGARVRYEYARVLLSSDREDEAAEIAREAIDFVTKQIGPRAVFLARVYKLVAQREAMAGELREAEKYHDSAVALLTARLGERHQRVLVARGALAEIRGSLHGPERAIREFGALREIVRDVHGVEHCDFVKFTNRLAGWMIADRQMEKAEELLAEVRERVTETTPIDALTAYYLWTYSSQLAEHFGRLDDALRFCERAERATRHFDPEEPLRHRLLENRTRLREAGSKR